MTEMSHRRSSPRLTAELAAKVKSLLVNTNFNYAQISAMLGGLNQGRVSEVKTGKRFSNVLPCSLEDALKGYGGAL